MIPISREQRFTPGRDSFDFMLKATLDRGEIRLRGDLNDLPPDEPKTGVLFFQHSVVV
jgi:hypothetical protein